MPLPYPGWNVVYGEIPAASKWSQLGANDDALAAGTGLNDLAITAAKIAHAAVTTSKFKPSIISHADAGGTNFTVTTTNYTDIPGTSFTYTSGPTAEKLLLWLRFMATANGASYGLFYLLNVNGNDLLDAEQYVTVLQAKWDALFGFYMVDIPANTTVTIKCRAKTQSGGNVAWGRDANAVGYRAKISGFAISNA